MCRLAPGAVRKDGEMVTARANALHGMRCRQKWEYVIEYYNKRLKLCSVLFDVLFNPYVYRIGTIRP